MSALSLAQRLALHKVLTERLKAVRDDELTAEAAAEWEPGERHSVKFAGQKAGWVSLPNPTTTVPVDESKLLPWARERAPHYVVDVDEVRVTDDLIAFLKEHRPEAVRTTQKLDPDFIAGVQAGFKSQTGGWVSREGELFRELPGVTIRQSAPSPRVNLDPVAPALIAQAWRSGDIDLGEMLALPPGDAVQVPQSGHEKTAESPAEPRFGAPGDKLFYDDQGRFRSPEMAALHAMAVQGGYSPPDRECLRMYADWRGRKLDGRALPGDDEYQRMLLRWLADHDMPAPEDETAPGGDS